MDRYSRVTVVGARRRLDIVLPSDEPVGRLLPDVLTLLDEPVSRPPRPRHLVTRTGQVLATDATLTAAAVLDGAVLELVAVDDSPPAPVVHDVTEETADGTDLRSWRWGPAARRWTGTVATVGLLAVLAALLRTTHPDRSGAVYLALLAAGCALGGGLLAAAHEPMGTAMVLGAGAVAMQAGWAGTGQAGWSLPQRWGVLVAVACALLVLLGAVTPVGRAGLVGGGFGLALLGMWWGGALAGLPAPRLASVLTGVSIVLIGLLPRMALVTAGLTRLDDRRAGAPPAPVARRDMDTALTAAHRTLGFAVLTTAVCAAVAGWLLAAHPDRWTAPLAGLLAVVLASRARTYPLAGQVVALLAAAASVAAALLLAWLRQAGAPTTGMLVAVAVAAGACVGLLAVEPPEHVRARLRRWGDRVEALAVVVTLPVLVGGFGVYGRLLHIF
jgi:type VII secretion integral membrane protein EccD